jgi:hypothetical protein
MRIEEKQGEGRVLSDLELGSVLLEVGSMRCVWILMLWVGGWSAGWVGSRGWAVNG